MAHCLSGIITSFKYAGALPHVYLLGDYAFIPLSANTDGFKGYALERFEMLTPQIKKLAREMSFAGKCGFIETSYHGGDGVQSAIVWQHGDCIFEASEKDDAINQALSLMGIWRHEGKDEFDTARLGWYRSNDEVVEAYFSRAARPG